MHQAGVVTDVGVSQQHRFDRLSRSPSETDHRQLLFDGRSRLYQNRFLLHHVDDGQTGGAQPLTASARRFATLFQATDVRHSTILGTTENNDFATLIGPVSPTPVFVRIFRPSGRQDDALGLQIRALLTERTLRNPCAPTEQE